MWIPTDSVCSASLDLFPPRTPFCLLAPVEGEEAQGAWSGALPSKLSPGMHYRICGELHFDFLKSPSSWLFLPSPMVLKAVAEGKPWVSATSPSFCGPSCIPSGDSADTPGEAQEGSCLLSLWATKCSSVILWEGETMAEGVTLLFPEGHQ